MKRFQAPLECLIRKLTGPITRTFRLKKLDADKNDDNTNSKTNNSNTKNNTNLFMALNFIIFGLDMTLCI